MFTPQEVSEKTFPKTSALTAGYNMAAVDEFLDPPDGGLYRPV